MSKSRHQLDLSNGRVLALLLALATLGGCAGRRLYEANEVRGGTQPVATDEPLERVDGPAQPPQPVDSRDPDPLLALMARMVANDGAWRPLAWKGIGRVGGARCGTDGPTTRVSPLVSAHPRVLLSERGWDRQWVSVGLTIDPGSGWVGLGVWPCGGDRATTAVASRSRLLAPDVTGRDTSVLFTTRRANVSEPPGSGVVAAVIEQFIAPRTADGESRKAAPRIRPRR